MNREDTHVEELTALSLEWRKKIVDLEARVDHMEDREQIDTIALVEHLKHQQSVVEQYLKLIRSQDGTAWQRNASEVQHMLNDIDAMYRRAMVYFD